MNNITEYPRFTVIIPQKNRVEYLEHTLRTCIIQDYPNLEFIVADDCSEDDSVDMVKRFMAKDSRIKLLEHAGHVGMRRNFEEALSMVAPGYVMALGGDDGLIPGCFWRIYEIIKNTNAQLVTWPTHIYSYADGDKRPRYLIRKELFKGVRMHKSSDYLNKIARTFNYLVDDCPMFYVKGVASTELVNRVKTRTPDGCFYYCPTPDGFSGVVLAGEVEEYAYSGTPLTITGTSPKSQGLNYERTDKRSREESEQFFSDNVRKTMHRELASQQYSPLITLMTADYLLTANDLPGWPGKFDMFTFDKLIEKTFQFLITQPFANEVLVREMKILREIAIQHNELELFEKLLSTTKRRKLPSMKVKGLRMLRTSYDFDADEVGLNNIYDAALATEFASKLCNSINIKWIWKWFILTLKTVANRLSYKTFHLPKID